MLRSSAFSARKLFAVLSLSTAATATLAQPTSSAFASGGQGQFSFPVRDGLTLTAELRLPSATPWGVVVILHGGAGVSELERDDERELLAQGLATVLIDSFGGRNYRPPAGTGAGPAIRPVERSADAFAVLRTLATHPDLKDKRAILFGRSHGGSAVMVAATSWAKQTYAPDGPSYVGYIALYPGCNAMYPEQLASNGPIRFHVGTADDLTPAAPCEAAVARMKAAGVDAEISKYEGAHHAFDGSFPVQHFSGWVSLRGCDLKLDSVTAPLPMSDIAKCATRGASMGANLKAAEEFRKARAHEIKQFVQ